MELEYSLFTLTPKSYLNHLESCEREGVYLKYKGAYAEYTPWKGLGDISVQDFLQNIKNTNKLPSFIQRQLSLSDRYFDISHRPFKNHGLNTLSGDCVKFKIEKFLAALEDDEDFKSVKSLRVDCNNMYSIEDFLIFLSRLDQSILEKIEYFEDPCPFHIEDWKRLKEKQISLASDRNIYDEDISSFKVYKPMIEVEEYTGNNIIYSSYMGSDLDRILTFTALMDGGDLNLFHGVSTPDLYEGQLDLFVKNECYRELNKDKAEEVFRRLEKVVWTKI